MKRVILAFLLLAATGSCFAQSDLVLHDADGDRMGVFSYATGSSSREIVLSTHDGYLIQIEPIDGALAQGELSDLFYISNDCSGQGYIQLSGSTSGWLAERGGHIVQLGARRSPTPFYVRVEWTPPEGPIFTAKSYQNAQGCYAVHRTNFQGVPATEVNPTAYGIKQRADLSWGFKLPFTTSVERPDNIFCNGFESCPTQ
jgi:hypothetical protein